MAKKTAKKQAVQNSEEKTNSLVGLAEGLASIPTINQTTTALLNNRYHFIFNNRQLLSELYIEHGIIQTLIDMPVDDAMRGGFEIHSDQLGEDDLEQLYVALEKDGYAKIGQTAKWGRLFGGAGLIPITGQPLDAPFSVERIRKGSTLELYSADLWELNMQYYKLNPALGKELDTDKPYMFYGNAVHESRVFTFKGKEPPSFRRPQFRGWGMSEVERMIRSFNQYIKNNNVIFELLDEAKVDVFKIDGFNNSMLSPKGTEVVQKRVQSANMIKNYVNALTMDTKDEYEQKNMQFAGLGEMLTQIRMGVASDLKMPITKLFGVSSAGFNSGEDDIENYNSMVEHEVRSKIKPLCTQVVKMYCATLFGYIPDDIRIAFPPLRILSAEQEQNVKGAKFNRVMEAFHAGIISAEDAKRAINKEDLLGIDIDENDDIFREDEQEGAEDISEPDTLTVKRGKKESLKAKEAGEI